MSAVAAGCTIRVTGFVVHDSELKKRTDATEHSLRFHHPGNRAKTWIKNWF